MLCLHGYRKVGTEYSCHVLVAGLPVNGFRKRVWLGDSHGRSRAWGWRDREVLCAGCRMQDAVTGGGNPRAALRVVHVSKVRILSPLSRTKVISLQVGTLG